MFIQRAWLLNWNTSNSYWKLYRHKSPNISVCIDFNIDLPNYDSKIGYWDFVDTFLNLVLFFLVDISTSITDHSASLIDNTFTNVINTDLKSRLLISDISGYLPVFCMIDQIIRRRNQGFVYSDKQKVRAEFLHHFKD